MWVKELQRQANQNIVIALAGNKIDLVQPRGYMHRVALPLAAARTTSPCPSWPHTSRRRAPCAGLFSSCVLFFLFSTNFLYGLVAVPRWHDPDVVTRTWTAATAPRGASTATTTATPHGVMTAEPFRGRQQRRLEPPLGRALAVGDPGLPEPFRGRQRRRLDPPPRTGPRGGDPGSPKPFRGNSGSSVSSLRHAMLLPWASTPQVRRRRLSRPRQ
jgi:hypothetical protein